MNPITTRQAITDLKSLRCACGSPKLPRQTFCKAHYYGLPVGMREALWQRCGEGYEEAYAKALAHHKLTSPAAKAESEVPGATEVRS